MDNGRLLIWIGCALAFCLNVPLIIGILKGTIRQSVATFILWTALDAIALASVIVQDGNYVPLIFFTVSGAVTTGFLFYKRLFSWSRFETFVTALVALCLVIWAKSGPMWATVASTVAVCIAGSPQARDSWRAPDLKTGSIYIGYTLVNLLFFFAGEDWSVKERFYNGLTAVLVLVIAVVSFRRKKAIAA